MFVMIDNYDSFAHILAMYFREIDQEITVIRNDEVVIEYLEDLCKKKKLAGIVISPGPKGPIDAGLSVEIVKRIGDKVPILGVCLGHQVIGYAFGAKVCKGKRPMHGKVTTIKHNGKGLFEKLPQDYGVTRCHSLVVKQEGLPQCLKIDAKAWDGEIMALRHVKYPIYGIQFHPEAVLSEYGHEIIEHYVTICRKWWQKHENTY